VRVAAIAFSGVLLAACGDDGGVDFDAQPDSDASTRDAIPGPDAAPSPADVAGLRLWLDATELSDLIDGDSVESWPDLSGNDNDANVSTAAPTYKGFEANGKASVRFDGVDDGMSLSADPLGGATDYTVVAVARRDAGTVGAGASVLALGNASGAAVRLDFGRYLNKPRFLVGEPGAPVAAQSQTERTELSLLVGRKSGDRLEVFVDGVLVGASTGATTGALVLDARTLGVVPGGTPKFFAGDVSEVLVYDRALAGAERQFVEQLLFVKYALTAASDTPFLPNEAPGMRLWLNAGFVDELPGDPAPDWYDFGPEHNGASAIATAATLIVDPVAGPVMRFAGAEAMALTSDPVAGTSSYTFMAVAKRDTGGGDGSAIVGLGGGAAGCRLGYAGAGGDRPMFVVRDSGGLAGQALSPTPTSSYVLLHGTRSGDTIGLRVNGAIQATVSGGFGGSFDWTDFRVGGVGGGAPLFFGGDIGEILIYERVITDTERAELESYLRDKYNIL
jgi:hypothetical protein